MQTTPPLPPAPFLGVGVGLRPIHYEAILAAPDPADLGVDWFEAISENYMVPGGRPPRILDEIRARFPIALHGVSLDVGSTDPLDDDYLARLAALIERHEPAWVSDHLCWSSVAGQSLHDLMPLPMTSAVLDHLVERVARIQDRLGRRIALENVSSYVAFADDEMPEWALLSALAVRADCGLLLDLNNIHVSAHNHGFDPHAYVDAIPCDRVFQIHLAGPSQAGRLLVDTHDHPVPEAVWALYERFIRRAGPVSTLIEWDASIPPFERLAEEAARARAILERVAGVRVGEPA
jgi:uncharacterized protein (UPF0276 family)